MADAVINGLGYLAIEVDDLDAADAFYCGGLGFLREGRDSWPYGGPSVLLAAGAQHLFLVEKPGKRAAEFGGTHQAYRISAAGREEVCARLAADGFGIETYREDRPAEADDNYYVIDPSGNRVQLVVQADGSGGGTAVTGIDHACVEDIDLQWSEIFYADILGLPAAYVHALRTEDYARAREWEAGRHDAAPGCNRMIRYYRIIPGQNRMQPRPSLQLFYRAGADVVGIYMAMDDYAEPPEEQLQGSPCLAFSVVPGGLDALARALEGAGRTFIGPIDEGDDAALGATIYCKDTGGNFLAFTEIK